MDLLIDLEVLDEPLYVELRILLIFFSVDWDYTFEVQVWGQSATILIFDPHLFLTQTRRGNGQLLGTVIVISSRNAL